MTLTPSSSPSRPDLRLPSPHPGLKPRELLPSLPSLHPIVRLLDCSGICLGSNSPTLALISCLILPCMHIFRVSNDLCASTPVPPKPTLLAVTVARWHGALPCRGPHRRGVDLKVGPASWPEPAAPALFAPLQAHWAGRSGSELGGSSVARAPREGRSCLCIPTTMSRHFLRLRASRRGVGTRRDCGPGLGHTAETEQMSRQPTGSAPLERTGGLHVPTPLLLPAPEALTHRVKESRVPPGTVGELRSPSSGR